MDKKIEALNNKRKKALNCQMISKYPKYIYSTFGEIMNLDEDYLQFMFDNKYWLPNQLLEYFQLKSKINEEKNVCTINNDDVFVGIIPPNIKFDDNTHQKNKSIYNDIIQGKK